MKILLKTEINVPDEVAIALIKEGLAEPVLRETAVITPPERR